MINDLAQQAIEAALGCEWNKALELNRLILLKAPDNIDAINRCAKAYFELGNYEDALFYTKKALEKDPLNNIANKCIDKYRVGKKNGNTAKDRNIIQRIFLEEPGKTKIVQLLNLAETEYLFTLESGDEAKLNIGRYRVNVCSPEGKYIGRFPDDIASRLIQLIQQGSKYSVFIKSAEQKLVKVIIREIKNSDNIIREPSFPIDRRA